MTQKLIAITGTDGSGKSSLIDELRINYSSSSEAEIWQPMYGSNSPFSSKKAVDEYLCGLNSNARLLFLSHALMESTLNAMKQNAEYLFLNAYYFKYFTTEMGLGADVELVKKLASTFPRPDLTIRLHTDLDAITERKKSFSKYECGLKEPTRENFEVFQQTCLPHWDSFENDIDLVIKNNTSLNDLVLHVKTIIEQV